MQIDNMLPDVAAFQALLCIRDVLPGPDIQTCRAFSPVPVLLPTLLALQAGVGVRDGPCAASPLVLVKLADLTILTATVSLRKGV